MKTKKLFFSEERFVFQQAPKIPENPPKKLQNIPAVTPTPEGALEKKATIQAGAQDARAELQTDLNLKQIEAKFPEEKLKSFINFFKHLNLFNKGTQFQEVPTNFKFDTQKDALFKEIFSILPEKDFPQDALRILEKTGLPDAEIRKFLTGAITNSFIEKLNIEFDEKNEEGKIKRKFLLKCFKEGKVVKYKFVFDSNTNFRLEFEPKSFNKDFADYLIAEKSASDKLKQEEDKKRQEKSAGQKREADSKVRLEQQTMADKIKALKGSLGGFVLSFFFGYDTDAKFEKILNGEDFVAPIVLGFFGEANYKAQYGAAVTSLSPRYQGLAQSWHAKITPFVEKIRDMKNKLEPPIAVDLNKFDEYVKAETKLSAGIKLTADYKFADTGHVKSLKITGGRLILPPGYALNERDGKITSNSKVKEGKFYDFTQRIIEISGEVIPVGTVFTSGIKFFKKEEKKPEGAKLAKKEKPAS